MLFLIQKSSSTVDSTEIWGFALCQNLGFVPIMRFYIAEVIQKRFFNRKWAEDNSHLQSSLSFELPLKLKTHSWIVFRSHCKDLSKLFPNDSSTFSFPRVTLNRGTPVHLPGNLSALKSISIACLRMQFVSV